MKLLLPKALRGSFLRAIVSPQFVIVLIVLLLVGNWLGTNFLFEPPTRWLGDYLLRQRERAVARVTRIVRIDEEDENQTLGGRSSVNGPALVNCVCTLLKSSPAVVVVDIDTSSELSFPKEFRLPQMGIPVIWAVDAEWESEGRGLNLKSDRVIGGRLSDAPLLGIARMPLGFDGVVRGWKRSFVVNGYETPSLPGAAVKEFCHINPGCRESPETSFGRDYVFAKMNLREFVGGVGGSKIAEICPSGGPSEGDPRLAGKIVVLGAFDPRADRHDTPWGTKYGAELVASAIEEDLYPNGLFHVPEIVKWMCKILLAIGIASLYHYFRPLWATAFTVVLLPLAVLSSGLAIFYFGDYDFAVVPLVVGILLEQLVTSAEKAEHWIERVQLHR